ncbi:MAG: polyphosphate kinase 1 [Planctomycetia bacterium]|nr:polyphosphate kinase 1 [Planctomycetia bacterium]
MTPKKSTPNIRPDLPENFIARDLSWLAFNQRVLQEGLDTSVPLAERLKFLAITSSNLDEFCKVRVAGAQQLLRSAPDFSKSQVKKADELLAEISQRTHELVEVQSAGIRNILREIQVFGLTIAPYEFLRESSQPQIAYLREYFEREILPILTPLAVEDMDPMPLLPALQLYVALWLRVPESVGYLKSSETQKSVRRTNRCTQNENRGAEKGLKKKKESFTEKLALIPVPSQLSRFVPFFASGERMDFVFLEEIIAHNADMLFPGCEVLAHSVFRLTRDEDVYIPGGLNNYAQEVENAVLSRKHREVVRLEITANSDVRTCSRLAEMLNVAERDIYEIDAPLDATVLFELAENPRLQNARYPDWPPVEPADLKDCTNIYERIAQRDVMLITPFEKFTPVVELLEKAAEDPDVLAIKQTLYRTSGDSPIVKALIKAAQNGKEVSVLVELRARFDESRNLRWTQRLEEAGCHVIYGIVGFKTHAKAMLIIRREKGRIMRYVHLSTGNYNDKTAKLYSDIALMTCNPEITADVAAFFNILTGYSESIGWKRLTVEPRLLKRRFIELIEREIAVSTPEQPGCIRAKINSLEDKKVIEALYRASQHGVKIQLNVRGICCLRPGIPGLSENIEVTSIIDRFLEHARIFYFHNGGDSEVYLASSDWMTRNLEHRLEILFPILSPPIKKRILNALNLYLSDNQKSQQLNPDGTWTKRTAGRKAKIRAQEILYREAVDAVIMPSATPLQYVPLQRPEN